MTEQSKKTLARLTDMRTRQARVNAGECLLAYDPMVQCVDLIWLTDDLMDLLRRIVAACDEYDAACHAELKLLMSDGDVPRIHEREAHRTHLAVVAKRAAIDEAAELLKGLEAQRGE